MPGAIEILDRVIRDLQELRTIMGADTAGAGSSPEIADEHDDLVDTWTISQRFNQPIDSVRWLAREKGYGIKRGNRWLISLAKARDYFRENG